MSQLSEDVKTVIACDVLNAVTVYTDELTTGTVVSDSISTNLLTLVDPNDITNTGTLEEKNGDLVITSPTVTIDGNAVVTGTMTVQTGVYNGPPIVITGPTAVYTLTFTNGLLSAYTHNP